MEEVSINVGHGLQDFRLNSRSDQRWTTSTIPAFHGYANPTRQDCLIMFQSGVPSELLKTAIKVKASI